MAVGKREIIKPFRMTKQEADILKIQSEQYRMTESAYLRFLLSQKPKDYKEIRELIRQLINEVNHIGTNINQIVHNNNSYLYSEADKEQLLAYMRKLNFRLKEAVDLIGSD